MGATESGRELATRQSTLRAFFLGRDGIRSGWSALIFLAILAAEVLVTRVPVNHLLHYLKQRQGLEAWLAIAAGGIPVLLVLVATAIMAKIEKRPLLS